MLITAYTEGRWLYAMQTDERIRPATEQEIAASDAAEATNHTGAIEIDLDLELLRERAPELCRRRGL